MNIESTIGQLALAQKIELVAGTDFMYTRGIPHLGIPSLCMADGPHGLRKQTAAQDNGVSQSEPATAFPTAATVACGWDPLNARRIGAAIAEECRAYNVHMLLGPGVNIKRNPLCGRNFEYFSEDPLLAGTMGAAQVEGLQSRGVGSCVKHFALNNSEDYRFMGNSVADQRTMRQIYLKPFEMVVRQAKPAAIMSAYNRINGTYCSQNAWLLNDVLRDQWGYDGLTMTDWGGMHDRVAALRAGLDLEMPGETAICRKWISDGIASGRLAMSELDAAVRKVLQTVDGLATGQPVAEDRYGVFDREAHDQLAAEIAADSAVLLTNRGVLPLAEAGRYVVVGDLFAKMRYQGAGSSMINPTHVTTPKDAFDARGVAYSFARGYDENQMCVQQDLIDDACGLAAREECDAVLVFAGLTDDAEGEGADRDSMSLPANQLALVEALARSLETTRKPLVVVLFGGGVVELPFADDVAALLYMALPGQNGGTACARLLFGDVCPSGHLAETWPLRYEDVPLHDRYGTRKQELYKEGMLVGYRWYGTRDVPVRYPFGYGLSYTSFAWSDLRIAKTGGPEGTVTATCTVQNTGSREGASTLQLYVAGPRSAVQKPVHELRAYRKVTLSSGQKTTVALEISLDDLRYYDPGRQAWVLEAGDYDFRLCSDAQTVVLSARCTLDGDATPAAAGSQVCGTPATVPASFLDVSDDAFAALCGYPDAMAPESGEITVESKFTELRKSFMGRILFDAVLGVADKQRRQALKMPEGPQRDNRLKGALFLRRVLESNSLVSMSMCAGDTFPYNFAQGFAYMADGHLIKGLKSLASPVRVDIAPEEPAGSRGEH